MPHHTAPRRVPALLRGAGGEAPGLTCALLAVTASPAAFATFTAALMSRSRSAPHPPHCQVRTCSGLGPSLMPPRRGSRVHRRGQLVHLLVNFPLRVAISRLVNSSRACSPAVCARSSRPARPLPQASRLWSGVALRRIGRRPASPPCTSASTSKTALTDTPCRLRDRPKPGAADHFDSGQPRRYVVVGTAPR